MQCQLCASFGDARFKFDGLPMESLRKHSKIHQLQIGRVSRRGPKTRSCEQQILKRCFPSVNAIVDAKSLNAETEITRRRRREFLNQPEDGSNSCSKKKRRIRDCLEETRQESASTVEKRGAIQAQRTPQQHTMTIGRRGCHGLAALRSHCYQLRNKLVRKGRMTCRQCSTELVVNHNLVNAVDHVTRRHFRQKLYACRFCSQRYSTYKSMAHHVNYVHHKSMKVAFIDLSEEYENEIMEVMTKCYGAAAKRKNGNRRITTASAPHKRGRTDPTYEQYAVEPGGLAALQRHCRELVRNFSQNGKITCHQCSTDLVACSVNELVDHVTRYHFGHNLYACRFCSKRCSAITTLTKHCRRVHHKSLMVGLVDLSDEYQNEIMQLITNCYRTEAKEESDNTQKVSKVSNSGGNRRITVAIRRCFRELKRNLDPNGKFTCRICANEEVPDRVLQAVSHIARTHFRKTLFSCCLCPKGFHCYQSMVMHVNSTHGLSACDNYSVHTDEYENEIIEWMKTCFGEVKKRANEQQSGPTE